jgi:drug/metabolite transporter (DMT)-like permease
MGGALCMLLCVFCWSTSGLFIKYIDWLPLVISGLRSGIAALVMLLVHREKLFRLPAYSRRSGLLPASGRNERPAIGLLLLAASASAGTKMLYVLANKLTTPANAILLHHSAPVWAVFLGWLLIGERPRKIQWAALGCICLGLVLFFVNGLRYGSLAGDGIALAAGICFGAGMVFLRMNREGSPELCLFISHCIPLGLSIPFVIQGPPVFTPVNTGAVLFLGIIQVGAGSLLYAAAIKRLRAIDAVFIGQLEPVLNPLWVFLFTGEAPAPLSIAGGVIIIAAVLLNLFAKKNTKSC